MLDKLGRYGVDIYETYYETGATGVLGETVSDARLYAKELVLGVQAMDRTKAYPLRLMKDWPVIKDSLGGEDLLIFLEQGTGTPLAYRRTVAGRSLTFRLLEGVGAQTVLVDDETGTKWAAITGRAVDGPLEGENLERAHSHLSFWFAWKDWNPDTEVYED